jgi:hypothetical protein
MSLGALSSVLSFKHKACRASLACGTRESKVYVGLESFDPTKKVRVGSGLPGIPGTKSPEKLV